MKKVISVIDIQILDCFQFILANLLLKPSDTDGYILTHGHKLLALVN